MRGIKAKQIHKLALTIYRQPQYVKIPFKRLNKILKRSYKVGGFKIGKGWVVDRKGVVNKYG